MNESEVRNRWVGTFHRILGEAEQRIRDSQSVPEEMADLFESLGLPERQYILPILSEWIWCDDPMKRYISKYMIGEFNIIELKGVVEQAIIKFENDPSPSVRYEVKVLRNILSDMVSSD